MQELLEWLEWLEWLEMTVGNGPAGGQFWQCGLRLTTLTPLPPFPLWIVS